MRLLDRIVMAGVIFLLVFTPLSITLGQGRPFRIAGTAAFLLLFLWMVKLLAGLVLGRPAELAIPGALKQLALPLIILFGLMAFEIVPLPPAVLRVVSPSTYHLYEKCLSGWPIRLDYDLEGPAKSELGTNTKSRGQGARDFAYPMNRTLSIAPAFTKSSLLSGFAYLSFFLVAAFYPFGAGNAWAIRKLIAAMLASGVLVAAIGLVERAFWNGKILWVFVPEDWGEPRLGVSRLIGPFVNPDHFANYLGMIFPLALAGVLFPWPFGKTRASSFARMLCAGALIVLAVAVLLSLSRAVWLAIPVSTAIFWRMVSPELARATSSGQSEPARHSRSRSAREGRSWDAWHAVRGLASNRWVVYGASLAVFTAAIVWMVGASARTEVDQRLGATFFAGDVLEEGARLQLDADTLRVIEGFPLLGVGLGAWVEIFPHFQRPPWSALYEIHAHNDYLELAAEIGLVGIVAFAWLCWRTIAIFRSAAAATSSSLWPWFAALVCATIVAAIHELFDFNLHTSANVFLLCGIVATAIRLATASDVSAFTTNISKSTVYMCASIGGFGAPVLALLAATLHPPVYRLLPEPESRKQALDQIVSYPADLEPHLSLARFDDQPTPHAMREFEIATWLDPRNPYARDSYVQSLAGAGLKSAAAEQIATSVMYSPDWGTHPYLGAESIASLTTVEREAIETGFKAAVAKRYEGAVDNLARFYSLSGRYTDEAELYSNAAHQQQEAGQQERFLVAAGEVFGKAGKSKEAQSAFEKAVKIAPSDARPYVDLLSVVYGPAKNMEAARSTVETGIRNGVDPIVLYSALAQAAQAANRPEVADAALTKIVHYAPTFQNNARLAEFYLASGNADRAVDTLRRAMMIEPDSAEAYVRLAAAEEAAYLYADADRDYAHALSLEPNNPEVKSRYAEFQKRTADKSAGLVGDIRN